MYSTTIFLLAFGLLATMVVARPERRPWSGHYHHHEESDKDSSEGSHELKWTTYRLPKTIRIPRLFAGKLGRPWPTFTAKKIFDGKYLLISPALMFRLKDMNNETDGTTTDMPASSTARPTRSTTEQSEIDDTTTASIDEESTTTSSTESGEEEEETTTGVPSLFKRRYFSRNDNEQLFFLDDK